MMMTTPPPQKRLKSDSFLFIQFTHLHNQILAIKSSFVSETENI